MSARGSLLSYRSSGSILSICSTDSILAVGAFGAALEIGSVAVTAGVLPAVTAGLLLLRRATRTIAGL